MSEKFQNGTRAELLFEATRQFANESLIRSWWYTLSTMLLLVAVLTGAGLITWWPARLALSFFGGLLIVRGFVLFHDFMHGAILRKSRIGRWIYHAYGLISLTPPRSWRHSHNFHHANVGKPIPVKEGEISLLTSDIGAVPLMTTDMWRQAGFWKRFKYRISRHPLTILFAYLTVFLYSICLQPLFNNPRKYWDSALSLAIHATIIAVLWIFAGFKVAMFAFVLPYAIASAIGAYLFFAQHNYHDMLILRPKEWSHYRAAIESSSFMKLGPAMNWFSANVGFHHTHHLNSKIPFYRLPEATKAIPELQHASVTTLRPSDVIQCFQLSLWEPATGRLVPYRAAARTEAPPAGS